MNRIKDFFNGIRERLARLALWFGAIAFLALLTILLIAPDVLRDLADGFSWVARGLILLVVYGFILLVYEIPLLNRVRVGRFFARKSKGKADTSESGDMSMMPQGKKKITPNVAPEPSVAPEPLPEAKLTDTEPDEDFDEEEEFWDFLESTAKDSEDTDTQNKQF